jgi:hypothetical protein
MYDFCVEWCTISEERPLRKTPVLVYRPAFFRLGFAVGFYDGVSHWRIFGATLVEIIPVKPNDMWAYLLDVDDV